MSGLSWHDWYGYTRPETKEEMITMKDNERIVLGTYTLTKRGERVLIITTTLLLMIVAVAVGTIETM